MFDKISFKISNSAEQRCAKSELANFYTPKNRLGQRPGGLALAHIYVRQRALMAERT